MSEDSSSSEHPAEPTTTRWWQAALLVGASLVLIFLTLELAARTYSWHLGKGFWNRPHSFESAFFVTYDWPPPIIEASSGTFRAGQTVPMEKPEGELRVICLGGSTTVNARNVEGLTYSGEVQAALRERLGRSDLFVLNAGGDAFSSAHSLANLSLRLLDFEPDVVTVLHNVNDLTARDFGSEILPDYSNKYLDDVFLGYEHRSGLGGAVFRFSRGAQMLKWRLTVLRRTLERSSKGGGVSNGEDGARIFERNLRSIVAIARAHGVRPLLITQANREPEHEAAGGEFLGFNNITRQLGHELDVPVVDVGAALSGRPELFIDDVHLTSDGVRALAAELLEPLETALTCSGGSPEAGVAGPPLQAE